MSNQITGGSTVIGAGVPCHFEGKTPTVKSQSTTSGNIRLADKNSYDENALLMTKPDFQPASADIEPKSFADRHIVSTSHIPPDSLGHIDKAVPASSLIHPKQPSETNSEIEDITSTQTETELKLDLTESQLEIISRPCFWDGYVSTAATNVTNINTYYDTPDKTLHNSGYSVRIRKAVDAAYCKIADNQESCQIEVVILPETRLTQTIKKTQSALSKGLVSRLECDKKLQDDKLDVSHLEKILPEDLKDSITGLKKMFCITYQRKTFDIEWDNPNSTVNIAIDKGHIKANDQVRPICQLELELKGTLPEGYEGISPLNAIYQLLKHTGLELEPSSMTKDQQGFNLLKEING